MARSVRASTTDVWQLVGDFGASPARGIEVKVERPGGAGGVGTVRAVKNLGLTVHEEITSVDPGRGYTYRILSGAPVNDYTGRVTLEPLADDGTRVCFDIQFQPKIPGTGWLVSLLSKRTINRILDGLERNAT